MTLGTSERLGEYLLKGWVMTNSSCPNHNVPLMRTPNSQTPVAHICVECDANPVPTESSSISSSSRDSRASTPPTELSSTLSSSTFALPPETEESRRRREQSDRASAEIGQRLLGGWTMLGDECPNSRCIGIPLVRAPKESSKECVSCGGIFHTETDWAGRERLVPLQKSELGAPATTGTSPSSSKQNPVASVSSTIRLSTVSNGAPALMNNTTTNPTTFSSLHSSSISLETAIHNLSDQLLDLSSQGDATRIGAVADAITRTSQALFQVRHLYWSEHDAGTTRSSA